MVKQKFLSPMQWGVVMVEAWTNPEFREQLEADPTSTLKSFAKSRFSVELERVMQLPPPPEELSAETLIAAPQAAFCCCCCTTLVNRPNDDERSTTEVPSIQEPTRQEPTPKGPSTPPKPDPER